MSAHWMKNRHRRAKEMLGHALVLGDFAAWQALAAVLEIRLTSEERASLLVASAAAAETADLIAVCEKARMELGPIAPPPPLMELADQANWWISTAGLEELQVYIVRIFARLPNHAQDAFRAAISERVTA